MRLSGDLIVRYLDAIELRRWLAKSGGEKNRRPPFGRYLHDVRQVLVGAIHQQSVQVYLGRFGAELAALHDETLHERISYPRKICAGVGKVADNAQRHPHLPELGSHSRNRTTLASTLQPRSDLD